MQAEPKFIFIDYSTHLSVRHAEKIEWKVFKMNFFEEDMISDTVETYEVEDDLTLTKIPNQNDLNCIQTGNSITANHRLTKRKYSNKENVCNNVIEPDQMQTILANIGPEDDVQLFPQFFNVVERNEKNITAECLGCNRKYKAQLNVYSNLVTHLKVIDFRWHRQWSIFWRSIDSHFLKAKTS